jgi:hypothetical protein
MHSWESGGIKPVARHGIGNARQHRKFLYVQSLIGITLAANLADVNSSELFVTGHGRCIGGFGKNILLPVSYQMVGLSSVRLHIKSPVWKI